MAKLYADSTGAILRLVKTDTEEATPPAGTVTTIDVDADTNAVLLHGLDTDWNSHKVIGGVLTRNGQPVTVNPPSDEHTERDAVAALDAQLTAYLNLPAPTAAQTAAIVKLLVRAVRYLVRHTIIGQWRT